MHIHWWHRKRTREDISTLGLARPIGYVTRRVCRCGAQVTQVTSA